MARIRTLADEARPHGSEKLTGEKDSYRIRVGDWRVIYLVLDGDPGRVLVSRIKRRNERTYR